MNYPDAALVDALASGEFANALVESLSCVRDKFARQKIEALAAEYSNRAASKPDLLLDLERDYTRMFFASKPRLVYLFESVYREGRLFQESTFETARLYHDAGLVLNEDFALPPDHIAVELEFLSFLYFKEIEGVKDGKNETVEYARELRQKLLDEHLKPFALNVAERVGKHAKCALYKAIAAVMREYFS